MLLWGPPGCGKTTLARIIARRTKSEFIPFSAVLAGIKEIKEVMAKAEGARRYGRRTIVFVDEMHRFNRAQQDAFLPHVEAGNIVLIGATTENPSFEVIAPLLSRMKVYILKALSAEQMVMLLRRALGRFHARSWQRRNRDQRRDYRANWRFLRTAMHARLTTRSKRWFLALRRMRRVAAVVAGGPRRGAAEEASALR